MVLSHPGVDVVHYAKVGEIDKHAYYVRDRQPGKWLPVREAYRPAPRFTSRRLVRLEFFRHPYSEYCNKVGEERDPLWVGRAHVGSPERTRPLVASQAIS